VFSVGALLSCLVLSVTGLSAAQVDGVGEDVCFLEISVNGTDNGPTKVYAGESVDLLIDVYVQVGLESRLETPVVSATCVTWEKTPTKVRSVGGTEWLSRDRTTIAGQDYIRSGFVFQGVATGPGPVEGEVQVICVVVLPAETGAFNRENGPAGKYLAEFFGERRAVKKTLRKVFGPTCVIAVPEPTIADGTFLGLVGTWQVDAAVEPATVAAGTPTTLMLRIKGRGPLGPLRPDPLVIPGFDVLGPEIVEPDPGQDCRVGLAWVCVPAADTVNLPDTVVSTFDPGRQTFVRHRFSAQLRVLPARSTGSGGWGPSSALHSGWGSGAEDVLPVKTRLGPRLFLPLWRNTMVWSVCMFLAGPIVFMFCTVFAGRQEAINRNQLTRRRHAALKRRRRIVRLLRSCASEELPATVRDELVPFLSDLLGAPEGITATAAADALEQSDCFLARVLRDAEHATFSPVRRGLSPDPDRRTLRASIRRLVAGAVTVAVLFVAVCVGAPGDVSPLTGQEMSVDAATDAYRSGLIEEARSVYASLRPSDPDMAAPFLLYNQGNCAYMVGHPVEALVFYERAAKWLPRDTQVRRAQQAVRTRLGVRSATSCRGALWWLTVVRDLARPDEWLLGAACVAFIWGVVAGMLRLKRSSYATVTVLAVIGIVVAGVAVGSQVQTSYRSGCHGIVLSAGILPRTLPSANASPARFVLRPGEQVQVQDRRYSWVKISAIDGDAWVRDSAVATVW